MQTAKLTSKGQITLPLKVRQALQLQTGDIVAFVEKEGRFEISNSNELAFQKVRDAFGGEAERLGIRSIEDVVSLVKEYRNGRQ
ncbi:AbrB family transcriptional regulator [Clostridia bacterium]|nr:AbrB family transcriptional regulator [Clostridia bacterium]